MPLLGSALSTAIQTALAADFPLATDPSVSALAATERQQFCDCIANAIVTYLVTNNLVTVVTPMGPGTGTFA